MGLDVEIYINGPLSGEIRGLAGCLSIAIEVSKEMRLIILYLFLVVVNEKRINRCKIDHDRTYKHVCDGR